ncbi:MAG: IS66 family insertion sequence element accessory protein TnpB [Hyphomicrobiaceae bacterium]|nr:IS66 family insertion sequence element accessory protein TnpB [Hyphomicrobiaceae bacterium]
MIFAFRAKRSDRIKLLIWDGSGSVLLHAERNVR